MGIPATWDGFRTVTCCRCGTGFAMEADLHARRKQDHRDFYCPNGHKQYFTGPSSEQKKIADLERQLQQATENARRAQQSREWAESRAKGANIQAGKAKAALKRLEHRIDCGVCPHCSRTFKQLAAHMKSKHPERTAR